MPRSTPHLSRTRHPVSDEERKGVFEIPVNVHVPQAGYHKLAGRVDHLRILWYTDFARLANRTDTTARNHHRHIGPGWRARSIYDCSVGEDEWF